MKTETELILARQREAVPQTLNLCMYSFSRSDCVEILKKCGDQNKFPEDHTAESICELLSPTDDLENCIPLDTYLSKYFVFFNFKGFFSLLSLPLMFALDEHPSVENMRFNDTTSTADSYLLGLFGPGKNCHLSLFSFFNFYWSLGDLQCCVSFRCTAK